MDFCQAQFQLASSVLVELRLVFVDTLLNTSIFHFWGLATVTWDLKVLSIKCQYQLVSNSIKNKISFSCRSESSNRSLGQCQIRQGRFFLSCLAFSWFLGATWRDFCPMGFEFILALIPCYSFPPSVFLFSRECHLKWLRVFRWNFASMWKFVIFRILWQNVQWVRWNFASI